MNTVNLTHFLPLFPFYPPQNIGQKWDKVIVIRP